MIGTAFQVRYLPNGETIPTVEKVDGGMFEDQTTGVSTVEGDYEDLGWSEWYPTETPEVRKLNKFPYVVFMLTIVLARNVFRWLVYSGGATPTEMSLPVALAWLRG